MSASLACDHSVARPTRKARVPCRSCSEAGISDSLVAGPGWSCACGWAAVTQETGEAHERLTSHHEALDLLTRRATLERDLDRLRTQIAAASAELAGVRASVRVEFAGRTADAEAELRAETRAARADLAETRSQVTAARATLRTLKADAEA